MDLLSVAKIELAVYGYIKSIKLSQDIPEVIKDVIVEFAKFYFNWRHSRYPAEAFEFDDKDPSRLIRSPCGGWTFLAMNDVLSLDISEKFKWEFIIQKNENTGKHIKFMFGFVEYPLDESIRDWDTYFAADMITRPKQFGIYVSSNYSNFERNGAGNEHGEWISNTATNEWNFGDKFGMRVDFVAKEIRLMYNDKDMGVIYRDIPDKILPAVSLSLSVELLCTKYEFE